MKKLTFAVISIISLALFISCDKKDENPTESGDGIKSLTMVHFGVDWSAGRTGENLQQGDMADGETIGWCTFGQWIDGATGIWYRPFNDKMYKIGAVDLSSVTSIDTTLWAADVCATPLANNDVWAAQCQDGYVVFIVTDQGDPNSQDWAVKVDYIFSNSINF